MKPKEDKKLAIYAHFPFCLRKCPYCDFVSYDNREADHKAYIEAVLSELGRLIEVVGERFEATSVYLGGGTPSLMEPELVEVLIKGINHHIPIVDTAEVTIEVNPATAGSDEMSEWHAAGVNRISLGIQSSDPTTLETLGRIHTVEDGIAAYEAARRAGFDAVSVDLIFGVPGQNQNAWMADLGRVIAWEPDHLSAYMLKPPTGWKTPPDEEVAQMYISTVKALGAAGLIQYEVSNFARTGKESRHNMVYWKKGDYIGLGGAAHSHLNALNLAAHSPESAHPAVSLYKKDTVSIRWSNVTEPAAYMDFITDRGNAVEYAEQIDERDDFNEKLLLGLRLAEGLDTGAMNSSQRDAIKKLGVQLDEAELAMIKDNRLILTPEGMLLADEIAARMSSFVNTEVA